MISLRENAFMTLGQAGVLIGAKIPLGIVMLVLAVWMFRLDRKKLVIKDAEGPYITRWHLIRTPWFRVFLHRIHRPDKDRHLHNHPWPKAFALVLWGGYCEIVARVYEGVASQTWNWHFAGHTSTDAFKPHAYHRIRIVLPNTWTLFFAGRRLNTRKGVSDWGFLVDKYHVQARPYLGLPPDHDFGD